MTSVNWLVHPRILKNWLLLHNFTIPTVLLPDIFHELYIKAPNSICESNPHLYFKNIEFPLTFTLSVYNMCLTLLAELFFH